MKNVQIIDGADNSTYSIYAFTEREFSIIFPGKGQDVEFIEDVVRRLGDKETGQILKPVWKRMRNKRHIKGIYGTLFFGLLFKKKFYPSKKDKDMITGV